MSEIEIKKVVSKAGFREFIDFYYDLYKGAEHAVPFLYFDEMATLRKDRNPSFECCDADYFIAFRDGKAVGRIAAIINHRANERWNVRQVRFGWFDFIDDKAVSRALLDTAIRWGQERGMTEVIGPMGFTDMDREGMMIKGYDVDGTAYVNYNYPYYPEHVEAYGGFEKDNDYKEFRITMPEAVPEKFAKIADMVKRRYGLAIKKFTRDDLVKRGVGKQIFDMVNTCYDNLYGYSRLSDTQIRNLVDSYINKADLNLIATVVDTTKDDQLVGFGVTFPSFVGALKKSNKGRLLPFTWWNVLKAIRWHKTDTVDLLLIGVLPEYRPKGANALIFDHLIRQFNAYGFKYAEAMQQMETNDGVLSHWQYLDSEQHRSHRVYKKNNLDFPNPSS